jgi:multisubunit Na+/H+ antiporter MnhC subunit
MTRFLLAVLSVITALLALWGCALIALGGVHAYMVGSGKVTPGEPIFVDEIALPLGESMRAVVLGMALVAFALLVRAYVRRKDNTSPGTEESPDK